MRVSPFGDTATRVRRGVRNVRDMRVMNIKTRGCWLLWGGCGVWFVILRVFLLTRSHLRGR